MSTLSVGSSADSPLSVSGLASGLDTSSIVSALMSAEREPVTRLTTEQEKLQGLNQTLQSVQSDLQALSLSASEFELPSLFETSQTVTSSEPTRVSAVAAAGAGIGAHEVEVKQLADSAQRSFTFTSPTSEQEISIDGHEFKLKAGETAKELAATINSDSSATVYAAVLEDGTLVLSDRATGSGSEFIKVSDPGGALAEIAGSAKEGRDAEYSVDGVAGTSSSNTVTSAIPGVTLTLDGLTPTGPVTIDVQPPAVNTSAIEAQVQSFVKLYNSTVEAIQKQLSTKPVQGAKSAGEFATGSLFGDIELQSLLANMREGMYEAIAGLPAEMSSPADIGIAAGSTTGSGAISQTAIEGQLTLNSAKLKEAVETDPAGVQKMLQQWSQGLQSSLDTVAGPGGTLEERVNGDNSQITDLTNQIDNMNEMLAEREKSLQATYAQLESAISKNTSQSSWLTSQEASLAADGL